MTPTPWNVPSSRHLLTPPNVFRGPASVQWHNHAVETTERLGLPVHYLYYENYTRNFDETVSELFNFLDIIPRSEAYPFVPGKSYRSLFSSHHSKRAADFVREVASVNVWKLLRNFFPGVPVEHAGRLSPESEPPEKEPQYKSGSTQVVWLLSFPNSVR